MAGILPITGEYPKDWKLIAYTVKEDAGWKCVKCQVPHNPDTSTGNCLTVHHFDGNKSNCEKWNLMPLCQRCHLSVQSRVDPENPLLFVPSLWAFPYIAGFYEAGRGVPGPYYDLGKWVDEYSNHYGEHYNETWPRWAPVI